MTTPETVALAHRNKPVEIIRKTDGGRFSSLGFNGYEFPLRISPIKFGDSGIYTCHFDSYQVAMVILVNIQGKIYAKIN